MPLIRIRGQDIEVEIRAELEQFSWSRPRWTSDKLIAASPFRYDKSPSFFINLDGRYAGTWADSGAYDPEWASGNFIKLLAFLRNETYEETEEYLISSYWAGSHKMDTITLKLPTLKLDESPNYIPSEQLLNFSDDYSYLKSRGINEEIQRFAAIKYDRYNQAIVIPWFDANKRLSNIKYRTIKGKTFWYERGAIPVRQLVYGIETIKGTEAVICEAEIDALSWRQIGVQAIAVGGANFTVEQADIIKRSCIELLYTGGDNDKTGRKFNEQVINKLQGHLTLKKIIWPDGVKDANEALAKNILVNKSEYVDKLGINR
jgi:hypothetical protein